MTDTSDADLLRRFRGGDDRSLEALFVRYESPLFQFLLGMLRDRHQAEDALQETFVRALERLDGVDPDHLRGWLFTVAYHQAMLLKRRLKRARTADVDAVWLAAPGPGPAQAAEQGEAVRRLQDLLRRLPQPQQEVIRRRIYEGQRFHEIAADLGCPLNTALARMHQGLKRLRLLWEQEHA